jgi:hypothetical protein
MVRALLADTKTQTRRIARVPDDDELAHHDGAPADRVAACCPYGAPGDRLWVRETFASFRDARRVKPTDASYVVFLDGRGLAREGRYSIRAPDAFDPARVKWRPSIHMPRWASRILLEITDVRLERLQDISEADAIAEGVDRDDYISARAEYAQLWDSINEERAPWAINPWVWVVSFRRVTT